MQNLPPGWRVSNSEGSYSGPSRPEDNEGHDESREGHSGSDVDENLDIQPDSPGWEDVEPDADVETLAVKCLICDEIFHDARVMLDHCRSEHSFDFLEIRRLHNLDFYATIRLVNCIRSAVKEGQPPDVPDLADPSLWADERFLQPVLEADALLFSLDELIDFGEEGRAEAEPMAVDTDGLENGHQ